MFSLRPASKIVLSFVISFMVSYGLINLVTSQIALRQQKMTLKETKIIQQEITERFNLILDVTLVIGQISSSYIHGQLRTDASSYGRLLHKILEEKEYILGLNRLDATGKIVDIYPEKTNQGAKGKISQNYNELLKSFDRGDKYWFSPLFKLYQGGSGFAFYIPIVDKFQLHGWIAPVISSQYFFERFKTMDFFKEYELVIKDQATGANYFSTGIPPETGTIGEVKSRIRGRDIIFQSWPKKRNGQFEMSFGWQFLICFLVAFFFAFVMKTYLQKKKAYSRLENISDVLKLTSKEALSKLMDIQSEYPLIGSTGYLSTSVVEKDIHSITNLIEQIELLQNIAETEQVSEENFEILPLLNEQLKEMQDVIAKKRIELKLDIESFKDIKVNGNRWLVSNTVLKNSLSYCLLLSRPSATIKIFHSVAPNECSTIFHVNKTYEQQVYQAFKIERRLLVARNIMGLLNGDIRLNEDGMGGVTLKLTMRS